jgi:hypothetical protein
VLSCVKTFIGLDAGDGNPSTGINDLPNPVLLHILTTSLDEVTWVSDDWTYWGKEAKPEQVVVRGVCSKWRKLLKCKCYSGGGQPAVSLLL